MLKYVGYINNIYLNNIRDVLFEILEDILVLVELIRNNKDCYKFWNFFFLNVKFFILKGYNIGIEKCTLFLMGFFGLVVFFLGVLVFEIERKFSI